MSIMTQVQKGSKRDEAILEAIKICKVMNTEQLTRLFFKFPSGKRKCQARLKILCDKKLIKKFRLSLDSSTVYYQGNFPGQPAHSLALSWIYVWMSERPGEKILTWDIEELTDFGLRADVLCSTKILMTNEIRYYCIELDRNSASINKYKKVDLYDDLYFKEGYENSKLMKSLVGATRFPKVLLVTDDPRHGIKIKEFISQAKSPVKYEVHLLNSLISYYS